jgi:hypothetical protein
MGCRIVAVDYDQTRAVLAAFEREGVRYVVFGGVVLNHRLKKGTVRPRDRADADRLRQRFGFEGD